jgi:hypothetical protein
LGIWGQIRTPKEALSQFGDAKFFGQRHILATFAHIWGMPWLLETNTCSHDRNLPAETFSVHTTLAAMTNQGLLLSTDGPQYQWIVSFLAHVCA